jgi:glycosyltransferase involved in cell wall biosynthesis
MESAARTPEGYLPGVRIAHVDAETGYSGGEVQVLLLMDGLRERGHDSTLIGPPGAEAGREARRRGHTVVEVPMRGDLDLPAVWRLARALREGAFELAHLHTGRATWLGSLAARRARIPAVTTRRMERPVKRNSRTRWLYSVGVRRAAAISASVERCLLEGGVPSERIVRIPSAVDLARVASSRPRDEVRAELGATRGAVLFLALGRLVPRKGIDVLLEALARTSETLLAVAGEGPERAALEARAVELEVAERVQFLGRVAEIGDLLSACDAVCMPSRAEGLGVAALEAMAAERPVVASRVGGLADAVRDGETGLLVPPADAEALAAALARLSADGELRRRLGAAGPARVAEGHLPEQMVRAYEALYAEVLAASG